MSYSHLARLYDSFAYDFDYEKWTDKYLSLMLSKDPGMREICDCGCGTGSIALPLVRRGYKVTGVDLSEEMLLEAQNKARAAGMFIPFVHMDMRRLRLPHRVDAVMCACDGVNYLHSEADVKAFFTSTLSCLKPGGVLAFDISNLLKLSDNGLYAEDMESQTYLWQNSFDEEKRLLTMQLCFFERCADGRYEKFTETHVQKAHKLEEIKTLLEAAGFTDIVVEGSDDGEGQAPFLKRVFFAAKAPLEKGK